MRRVSVAVLITLFALALFASGCTQSEPEAALEPTIAPPVIGEAGVLRAGIDLEYPPFGGTDKGREAGLDIDVASALAAELGLELETVDVKPSEAATAFADGTVDVVLSVPFAEETLVAVSLAGTYATDGPAFFVSTEGTASAESDDETATADSDEETSSADSTGTASFHTTMTIDTVGAEPIGVQEGSEAFWVLQYELGEDALVVYPTLREAMDGLEALEIGVIAGDAFVGSYIARDYDTVVFAGQLGPATPLGVAVAQDGSDLEEAVRGALDALAADGVLDAIRSTWVGDLPELETKAAE